jgi:tetratricopeptide (TPR) repeat protein
MPDEPGFHYGLATREMQFHKNTEGAMVELDRAIDLKTRSLLPYYARSCLWVKKNDAKAALADATSAIDANPYFDMSYQLRAKAYRRLGDQEAARKDDRRQVWLKGLYDLNAKYKAHPEKDDLALELSKHYSRGEEWKPALRILTATMKQDPRNLEALRQRSQIYLAMGNLNAALTDAMAAVTISPEPGNYSLRGDVYAQRRDWDKAVADYERAKCLDDRLEQALRQRAAWHSAAGRVEPAKADMEEANRISQAAFSTQQN